MVVSLSKDAQADYFIITFDEFVSSYDKRDDCYFDIFNFILLFPALFLMVFTSPTLFSLLGCLVI